MALFRLLSQLLQLLNQEPAMKKQDLLMEYEAEDNAGRIDLHLIYPQDLALLEPMLDAFVELGDEQVGNLGWSIATEREPYSLSLLFRRGIEFLKPAEQIMQEIRAKYGQLRNPAVLEESLRLLMDGIRSTTQPYLAARLYAGKLKQRVENNQDLLLELTGP